jgi:prepilin-type N-terminal cleavage/methylation domain-containing protein
MISNTVAKSNSQALRALRAGYSLVEVVVAMSVMAILMVGMTSTLYVHSKNRTQDSTIFAATEQHHAAARQIFEDLTYASAIVEYSSTAIEFEVPDRDSDGYPERIRYEWMGSSGGNANKLRWTYNQGTAVDLLTDATACSFTYSIGTVTNDVLNFSRAALKLSNAVSGATNTYTTVSSTNWVSQFFQPTLPGAVTKWDLGGYRIMMRRRPGATITSGDYICCEVYAHDSNKKPTGTALSQINVQILRLGTDFEWVVIRPKLIKNISSSSGLCLVVKGLGSIGSLVDIAEQQTASSASTTSLTCTTTNSGAAWSTPSNLVNLRYMTYGAYPTYSSSRNFLVSVNIDLTSTINGSATNTFSRARLLNAPEVP